MDKNIRLFLGRLYVITVAALIAGSQFILLIRHQGDFKTFWGSAFTLSLMVLILMIQIASQIFENRRNTTSEEFEAASLFNFYSFGKIIFINHIRFYLMISALLILGAQITLMITSYIDRESIISALLGTSAMMTLVVSLLMSQIQENKSFKEH
ncbi:MAG: hypothetical protein NW226_07550 [Microscillaceae bacterium]|nr:hypothetical protein [Microscillaceae bacterium]